MRSAFDEQALIRRRLPDKIVESIQEFAGIASILLSATVNGAMTASERRWSMGQWRTPFARATACALLALCLSACAAISSRPALGVDNNPTGQTRGMPYYLPKGLLRVSIVVVPLGEFRVTVAAPIMVPDRDFLLHADIRHGALSDDLTIVKIDPKTSLLTSADVTSTGRAAEFAENLVKGFGMLQASGAEGGQVIFSALYDFDDLPTASAEASKALHDFIASKCDKFAGLTDADFARVRKESAIAAQDDIVELQADLDRCRRWAVSGHRQGERRQSVCDPTGAARFQGSRPRF